MTRIAPVRPCRRARPNDKTGARRHRGTLSLHQAVPTATSIRWRRPQARQQAARRRSVAEPEISGFAIGPTRDPVSSWLQSGPDPRFERFEESGRGPDPRFESSEESARGPDPRFVRSEESGRGPDPRLERSEESGRPSGFAPVPALTEVVLGRSERRSKPLPLSLPMIGPVSESSRPPSDPPASPPGAGSHFWEL